MLKLSWRVRSWRSWRWWLRCRILALALVVACGSSLVKRPVDVSGRVLEEVLGGAPDFAMAVRLGRVMADPLYGPILRCALTHAVGSAGADVATGTTTLDVWMRDDAPALAQMSAVMVLRGPPRFHPALYRGDDGRQEWAAGKMLPSGVIEHAPVATGGGAWLFVVRDELVIVRGRAVDHAREHFAALAAAPAILDIEPTAIAQAWVGGPSLVKHGGEVGHEIDGATTATFALLPGPEAAAVARLQLDSDARAVAVLQRIRDWGIRDVCPACRALSRYVHGERAGAVLRVDLHAPAGELDETRSLACSAGKPPEHLAQPLPPDYSQPPLVPPRVAVIAGKEASKEIAVAWTPVELRPGEHAVQLATYDDHGKLLRRLDAGNLSWQAHGENALAVALEPVIVGGKVAVHDLTYVKQDDDAILLYDVATGKRTGGMVVPARGRLCASPSEPLVFVEDDEPARQTMIRVDSAAFSSQATRPSWCPARPKGGVCGQPATLATCLDAQAAPSVADLTPLYVLASGDDAVVLGERTVGGRHVAMAAGFDLATRMVRWKRLLPTSSQDVADEGSPRIADLAYGALLVEYDEWHGKWKLAALDAKTGKTRWDTALPAPAYFGVSPGRVWFQDIERRPGEKPDLVTTLRALDLETGKPKQ